MRGRSRGEHRRLRDLNTLPFFLCEWITSIEQMATTKIPNDFVIDAVTIPDEKLHKRYALGWRLFHKDIVGENELLVPPVITIGVSPLEDFKQRMVNLRKMILMQAESRTEGIFRLRFNRARPNFRFKGRPITSSDEFNEAYKVLPYDKEMAAMVALVSWQLWGSSNQWASRLEHGIMQKFKIEYTGQLLDKTSERKVVGGSIAKMINRQKQSKICNKLRRTGRKFYKMIQYKKDKNMKVPDYVVKLDTANVPDHGYEGYRGLCEGHPELTEADYAAWRQRIGKTPDEFFEKLQNSSQNKISPELQDWVTSLVNQGKANMADALQDLRGWEARSSLAATGTIVTPAFGVAQLPPMPDPAPEAFVTPGGAIFDAMVSGHLRSQCKTACKPSF